MTRRVRGGLALAGAALVLAGLLVWWQEAPSPARLDTAEAWLEVRVVGLNGEPARGARVELEVAAAKTGARPPKPLASDADAAGLARVGPLPAGAARVRVTAAHAARHEQALALLAGPNALEVKLVPEAPLTGTVVDETGATLAGALLQATAAAKPSSAPSSPASTFEARSDAAGRFRFEHLPAGTYALQASAERHELAVVPAVSAPAREPVEVVLPRTAVLHGEVLDDKGQPASEATVTIAGSGIWPPKALTTDARGQFEVSPLPGGVYELRARRATFASAPQEGVIVEPGGKAFVRLALEPGTSLRGRAFDAETGTALRGVAVTVGEDALSSVPSHATTAADGTFAIEGLRALPHRVWMHAPGYVPIAGDPITPRDQPYEFPLRRSAVLSGVIVDETNHPVANADLEVSGTTDSGQPVRVSAVVTPTLALGRPAMPLVPPTGDSLGVTVGAVPKIPLVAPPAAGSDPRALTPEVGFRSDAAGHFRIEGVPPGRVQVAARRAGFAVGRSPLRDVRSGEEVADLRIVLPLGGTLLGRVLDARGFPLPSVRLQLDIAGEPAPRVTLSGEDGRFEFAAVRGACSVTAFPLSGAPVRQAVEVASGERQEVSLVVGGETRTLAGRVVDGRGFPISGALVRVDLAGAAAGSPPRTASSASDGTFQLGSLPPPPYRVQVEHPDYATAQLRAAAPAAGEELTIALSAGARVTGLVLDQMSNDGIAGAAVRLRAAGAKEVLSARTDARGQFEFRNVSLGSYEVFADAPLHTSARGRATVSQPGSSEVDPLVLQPAGAVSGDVVDRIGVPVFNAEVALGQPPAWSKSVRTDHRGHFTLNGVAPGDQRISARHAQAGASAAPVPVRVYPRQESPGLVLRLAGRLE
jgi:protocatechuate 3,4-dioxygenase beta subunit